MKSLGTTDKGWEGFLLETNVIKVIDEYSVLGDDSLVYTTNYPIAEESYAIGDPIVIAKKKSGKMFLTKPDIYSTD